MLLLTIFSVCGDSVQSWFSQTRQGQLPTEKKEKIRKNEKFAVYCPTALMNETHFYPTAEQLQESKNIRYNELTKMMGGSEKSTAFLHTIGTKTTGKIEV